MKKTFIILFALIALLAVVSCKQDVDPNIYQYDASSYLGAWEMNFAAADGDEDGCIHLMQINFEKDCTYSIVEYFFDAQTNNIKIVDGTSGTYEATVNAVSKKTEIVLDSTEEYYWTEDTGLEFYNALLKSYDFSRPKYVVKVSKDQSAIEGVWEERIDSIQIGINRLQFVFNADGTADMLDENGFGADHQAKTMSWKYKAGTVKDYQITVSMKWYQGSEMVISANPSSLLEDMHEQKNYIVLEVTATIINDGTESITTERYSVPYTIYDYGNERICKADLSDIGFAGSVTLVKKSQSDLIDVNKKLEPVVNTWDIATGTLVPTVLPAPLGTNLYLKSDGKFFSDEPGILTPDGTYPHAGYYGSYSIDLDEAELDDFLEAMKTQWTEAGSVVPDWDAWKEVVTTALIDEDAYTYEFYTGTLTLDPEYGGTEEFEISLCKRTELYGDHSGVDPVGPQEESVILFKKGINDYRWLSAEWDFN